MAIQVLRASSARIIGNTISRNGRNGLTVQQASHADVAGNLFDGNAQHGIRVFGNSGVTLADSAMLLFTRPNTTTKPNGSFGIQCEVGAYRWAHWRSDGEDRRQGRVGQKQHRSIG